MKTYQDGEIYFIREMEYPSGKPSAFVKVGLVRYKENRDSFGRLTEHQTGNPRRLSLKPEHIVKTQAVDMVEAQLHRRFATKRIVGEWFEFQTDADIDVAVAEANNLAKEVAEMMPLFKKSMELDQEPSNGKVRPAKDGEKELLATLVVARKQKTVCEAVAKELKAILEKAYSEGADITVAARNSVTVFSPRFLVDEFKEENEVLWEKYLVDVQTWKHTFSPGARAKELGSDFDAQIEQIRTILESVKTSGNFSDLVEVNLVITNLKGIADWDAKVSEAKLKIATDVFEGIEDVCTWKREWESKKEFDSTTFAAENPELAKKYVSTPAPKATLKVKTGKA
jgi:hypothetical protein